MIDEPSKYSLGYEKEFFKDLLFDIENCKREDHITRKCRRGRDLSTYLDSRVYADWEVNRNDVDLLSNFLFSVYDMSGLNSMNEVLDRCSNVVRSIIGDLNNIEDLEFENTISRAQLVDLKKMKVIPIMMKARWFKNVIS